MIRSLVRPGTAAILTLSLLFTVCVSPLMAAESAVLSGRVLNEMCTHALETRPEECCGLVSGSPDTPRSRFLHVHRCRADLFCNIRRRILVPVPKSPGS